MIPSGLIEKAVAEILEEVVEVRRTLHRCPELAHQEVRTTELLARLLGNHGIATRVRSPSRTGLVAEVGSDGPMVAWRADLDALPIQEPPTKAFASEHPGVMHACGHDAHAAIGLGVATVLNRIGPLPGRVRLIFQHSEESLPSGASQMLDEDVLDQVQGIAALHVDATLELGKVGLKAGAITSSSDRVQIVLQGPGGHTARPHLTADLLFAAGKVLSELPGLLGRMVDARLPFSLTFGSIKGGKAENVIPTEVVIAGTCRTPDPALRKRLPDLIRQLTDQIVAPTGATAQTICQPVLPPVYNDRATVDTLRNSLAEILGSEAVVGTFTSLGAEDFSYYLDRVPGVMMRLGTMTEGERRDLHSAWFQISEDCLEIGVKAGVASVLGLLSTPIGD
jgi:amidohydrolase